MCRNSLTSAFATSAHCVGAAMEQIPMGKRDVVFAGGVEEKDWTLAAMFDAIATQARCSENASRSGRSDCR